MTSSEADVKTSLPPIPRANPLNSALEDPAVKSVLRRWKIEDSLDTSLLILRILAWIFSLLAFAITASNKHGDWMNFDMYQEYRYLLAISILVFLYTTAQLARYILRSSRSRREILPTHAAVIVDFSGDQIAAYLLISGGSAAAPITNRMHESVANNFTDASAASVVMVFFGFITLALSALVSGFKLARHNYA